MFEKFKTYGYRKYKKIRYNVNKVKTKRKSKHIELKDLIKDLKNFCIKEGEILLVHSSLKSMGFVLGGGKTIIQALLEVIGPEGTLVIPTFPYNGNMLQLCKKKNIYLIIKLHLQKWALFQQSS